MKDKPPFTLMFSNPKEETLNGIIKRSMTEKKLQLLTNILLKDFPELSFKPLKYVEGSDHQNVSIKVIGNNPYGREAIINKFEQYKINH